MTRKLDWTPAEFEALLEAYERLGGVMRHGTAMCIFCRPTDAQLRRLREGEVVDGREEDCFSGPNVYSFAWFGCGVGEQMALTRKMAKEVRPGGVMATHAGAEYREWRPELHGKRGDHG